MTISDHTLAGALSDAPPEIDPAFRAGVLMRIAEQAHRRAAARRAMKLVATFAAIGLAVPAMAAVGLTGALIEPVVLAASTASLAYAVVVWTTEGSNALLARLQAATQFRI